MKRNPSFAVLAALGAFVLVVLSGVPLPYAAHAQAPPSVAVSLSSASVEQGAAIAVTMSFGGLESDADTATRDYLFRADVVGADGCEGDGLGVDRYMHQVDEDPETRTGTISAGCPAGDYTLEASISSPDGVELASARAGFRVAEPEEEEDDPPASAQQQSSVVTVPADWTLKPSGLGAGDQFRLLIVTSTTRNANSTDISDYDAHVQTAVAAGHAGIRSHSSQFQVVGCTAAVDARDHTGTTYTSADKGVPIYWLDGNKAADEYEDFYDGSWDEEATGKNESGTDVSFPPPSYARAHTGCDHDGTESFSFFGSTSYALGRSLVRVARANAAGQGPLSSNSATGSGNARPFYGLSPVFQVAGAATPPTLSGLTVSAGTLTPAFASGTLEYAVPDVPNADGRITVTATADADVTVAYEDGSGTALSDADSDSAGFQADLVVGENTIKVKLTRGGASQTYTLKVTRAEPPCDAIWCATLTVGTLVFAGTPEYGWSSPSGFGSITDRDFSYDGDRYEFTTTTVRGQRLEVYFSGDAYGDLATEATRAKLNLHVGEGASERVFNLGSGSYQLDEGSPVFYWENSGLSWSVNDKVSLKLKEVPILTGLTVSAGTLTPAFGSGTLEYAVPNVPNASSRITVTATPETGATVAYEDGSGNALSDVDSGTAGDQFDLEVGENTIQVKLTKGGASQTYTLKVTRAEPTASSDASLSALNLGVTLSPGFASATISYSASVPNSWSVLTVTATPNHAAATVDITPTDAFPSFAGDQVNLDVGSNTISVKVTAEDGTTTRTYTVTVTRAAPTVSSDASLSGLSLSSGTLSPDFASATLSYAASVVNSVSWTTVTATPNHAAASVLITPTDADATTAGDQVNLDVGSNTISVKVTAEDGTTTRTYTVTVTRAAPTVSSDASLSGLSLSSGTLSPDFASATLSYAASVVNSVSWTTVTATPNHAAASVLITPTDADATTAGDQVNLDVGSNTISVKVTAEDGTTQTYTVTVTRAANSVTVVVGAPDGVEQGTRRVEITWVDKQDCADGYKAYVVVVASGVVVNTIEIPDFDTDTADVITADMASFTNVGRVQVWCGERGSGRMVGEVAVPFDADNSNRGIPGTYTTAAAGPPALSGLTVSAGTLTPVFASGTLEYTVPGLPYGNNRITVTATADDATVAYEDGAGNTLSDVDADTAGDQFDLAVGENTIKVKLTRGSASQTYTLTLTRAAPAVSIGAAAATAGEGDSLTFTVTRTPAAGDALTLTVNVSESGDLVPAAEEGDRTVTIAANATATTLTVATGADDSDWEEHSTVSVTAPPNAGYTLSAASASTLVEDDDFPEAEAALTVSPTTVDEPGTATVTITVTTKRDEMPHGPGGTLTVASSDVTASAGSDYDAFSQSYTLEPAGFSAVTIFGPHWQAVYTGMVTVRDDSTQESAETFQVALTKANAPKVILALPSAFVVTIPANDAPATSSDASLSGLALSGVTLSPDFASDTTTGYTASVYNSVTSTTVTATPNHAAAKVVITPADADLSAEGYQVNLDVGSNTISVKVTAEDGTTQPYTVTVTRAANSVTVVVSAPDGVTGGDRKFEITWVDTQECTGGHSAYVGIINENGVVVGTTKVTDDVTDTADVITATYDRLAGVNLMQVWCGEKGSGRMVGEVVMTIDPATNNRVIPGRYSSAAGEPPTLSGLTVSAGTLTPAFAGGTLEYTVPGLAYGNNRITVTATADADATVSYEDGAGNPLSDVDSTTAGDQFDLAVGENTIRVRVTEGGLSQTYTLTVTRAKPQVSIGAAAATAGEGDSLTFTVTRTPAAGDALTLTVNVSESGDLVPAAEEGDRTVTIAANATATTLTVATGADDSDWEEHSTVSVTAPPNAGYTLGAASASTLVEDDDFPAATAHLVVSPASVSEPGTARVTVSVTTQRNEMPHGPGGTLTVVSSDVTASAGSDYDTYNQSYALDAAGFSAITIGGGRHWWREYSGTVTVREDTTQESAETFHLVLTKSGAPKVTLALSTAAVTIPANDAPAASSDASLSALSLSSGTLSPGFTGATTSYAASVINSVSWTTVTATPNHAAASVLITPTDADANRAGDQVNLDVGSNTISVKVTAEDGATRTYTVTVTRAAPPASSDASLSGLSLSGVTLTPTFAGDTISYTASVANSVSSTTVTATKNQGAATVVITPTDADANAAGRQVNLDVGSNTISVKVTAEDGTTSQTYTVTVTRAAAAVANSVTAVITVPNPLDEDRRRVTVSWVDGQDCSATYTAQLIVEVANLVFKMVDDTTGSDDPADVITATYATSLVSKIEVWCGERNTGRKVGEVAIATDSVNGWPIPGTYTTAAADSAAPQPTIVLDPEIAGFGLVIRFGEGVSGFDESDLTLGQGWTLVSGSLEADASEAGTYRVGFRPERELAGLTADLAVTLPAGAASDLAANPSLEATLREADLYAGPAVMVYLSPFEEDGTYDPGSLAGEFRVGFVFIRDHVLAAPVTGFDATDIALTNASVRAFIAKPPRGLYGADPVAPSSDEYAGSYLYEATIVPDAAACASGCTITVGVPHGAALGAISAAEAELTLTHLVQPNVAAEPLTVQREGAGSGARVSALAVRQAVNSDDYWVDVLISGSSQNFYDYIRVETGETDPLLGWEGGLHSFWAQPPAAGMLTLSIDLNRNGSYEDSGVDFTYVIRTATAQAQTQAQEDETAEAKAKAAPEPATIPDAALRGILERILGKEAGAAITTEQLATLLLLDLRGSGVAGLAGLEHALRLADLYLDDPSLDLSPLEGLGVVIHLGVPPAPSSDAALSGLELSGVDFGAFDPATAEYTAGVGNGVTEVTVTPTTNDDGATYLVELDGTADSDAVIPLAVGSNVIAVEVTAEDGETTQTYTVTVTRAAAPDPGPRAAIDLSAAAVVAGTEITVTMSFGGLQSDSDTATRDYVFRADVVDAENGEADACEERANGYGLGVDRFMWKVDEDPETRTGTISAGCPAGDYTLRTSVSSAGNVELASASASFSVREPETPLSSDAALSGLALSGVDFGAFDPAATNYAADVGHDVTETTVTATVNDGGASYLVKLDGVADSDGTVSFVEGSNVITIEVAAEDGETVRTYTVTVTRAAPPLSTDATLSGLELSGMDIGTFDPATAGYTAGVANGVDETTVKPTVNDDGASYLVKLNGAADADGVIPLAVGSTVITVEITAEDGHTTRTYTVTVTRAAPPLSTDATLSGLELSDAPFTFASDATGYEVNVAYDVDQTTVTATANDDGAAYAIRLDGVADADGVVPLAVGSNVIAVEVTAEDGQTTRTYTVTVTRAAPPAPSAPFAPFAPVTVTLSPRPEHGSTGSEITIEWSDSGACGGEYFVGLYRDERLEVVIRGFGYHPAPATTRLSADLGLSWKHSSSSDWWVGVICTSAWTEVGKASLQSGLP